MCLKWLLKKLIFKLLCFFAINLTSMHGVHCFVCLLITWWSLKIFPVGFISVPWKKWDLQKWRLCRKNYLYIFLTYFYIYSSILMNDEIIYYRCVIISLWETHHCLKMPLILNCLKLLYFWFLYWSIENVWIYNEIVCNIPLFYCLIGIFGIYQITVFLITW